MTALARVRKHFDPHGAAIETVLFRVGFWLLWGGILSATVHGALGLRFLSVVAHATVGITALIFMAMGHVWERVTRNLEERVVAAESSLADALLCATDAQGDAAGGAEREPAKAEKEADEEAGKAARKAAKEIASAARSMAEEKTAPVDIRARISERLRKNQDGMVGNAGDGPEDVLRGEDDAAPDPATNEALEALVERLEDREAKVALEALVKEVSKQRGIPPLVLSTLVFGAALNVLAGLLAAVGGLHGDPLAVVSAGWTTAWVDCGDLGGACAWPGIVKLAAVLGLAANSIGIIAFAHAIYDRPSDAPFPNDMDERLGDRLVGFGTLALVVGFLAAWLPELSRVPRLGVGTYATLLIIGPMFICFGRVWPLQRPEKVRRVQLSYKKQRATVTALSFGVFGVVVAGMVLALLGMGGTTLAVSAQGAVGSDRAELLAKIVIYAAILLVAVGMILFWIGVRPLSRTLVHRIAWALSIVALALILEAAFYHMTVNYRLAGEYPIRLPDYRYGYETWTGYADRLWDSDNNGGEPRTAQNWTRDDWQWFYHAPQGGAFEVPIPYDWLIALEQPAVDLWPPGSVGLLMDPDYLQRFGFLPNPESRYDPDGMSINQGYVARYLNSVERPGDSEPVDNSPDGLPIGFARTNGWVDQSTGEMLDVMGFTCAACHTSQIDYEVAPDTIVRLRIEGGPANVDLGKFRQAVGVSLGLTRLVPGRFERFANRLDSLRIARAAPEQRKRLRKELDSLRLEGAHREERRRLREELDFLVERVRDVRGLQDSLAIYPTVEGFARLDAVGRIFNFVFGSDLDDVGNLGVANAPVNFPYLWDTPRFNWVQYTASFQQPMIRNAGQSMGVFASVDMKGAGPAVAVEDDPKLFTSSINVLNVHDMELLIAGCTLRAENRPEGLPEGCRERPSGTPFEGLESPEWPGEIFDAIDTASKDAGRELYLEHCARCHLPPPDSLLARDPTAWTRQGANDFLALRVRPLAEIGTDPRAAINFAARHVDLGELGERLGLGADSMQAAEALPVLIDSVLTRRYRHYGVGDSLRPILDGHRAPKTRIELGYRARPLNGVWATAPFLHNGSVPTLYHLLSPQAERPRRFFLGSRLFDPEWVGFDYVEDDPGYFEFDASQPGNSNLGHSFEGSEHGWRGRPGVLGPEFTPEERMQIIEYLKSMGPLPVRPEPGVSGAEPEERAP